MENLSFTHILLLTVICLVVFGAKRIPEMGSAMGKGIRAFKRGMRDDLPDDDAPTQDFATDESRPKKLSE